MTVGVYVSDVTFSDGTRLALNSDDIVVLTGPNNSGKSSVLREIVQRLGNSTPKNGPVLTRTNFKLLGTTAEIELELRQLTSQDGAHLDIPGGGSFPLNFFSTFLDIIGTPVVALYYKHLDTQTRLSLCRPTPRQNLTTTKPSLPLSVLEIDSAKEDQISALIKDNFGFEVVLNRAGGAELELVISSGSQTIARDRYHTREYYDWVSSLPKLDKQGDGVRSFAGILLSMVTLPRPLILIDEPEAFLHPPQARAVARFIAGDAGKGTQIFVATHSDDFIRGFLDANSERTKIVRLQRQRRGGTDINKARILDKGRVQEMWGDAILRTSDVLTGLFHNAVAIVEGESDARFLRAMLDSLSEASLARSPDIRFTYGTGFGSVAKIASALRAVEVPVVVIVDQDTLCSRQEIEAVIRALGGQFDEMRENYAVLMSWLNGTSINVTNGEVAAKLTAELDKLASTAQYTAVNRNALKRCISPETPRDRLRERGRMLLVEALAHSREEQAGTIKAALAAYDGIIERLGSLGVLFYPGGWLEGLSPEDLPKPGWLERVLQRNLATDSKLENGREFAELIIDTVNSQISRP